MIPLQDSLCASLNYSLLSPISINYHNFSSWYPSPSTTSYASHRTLNYKTFLPQYIADLLVALHRKFSPVCSSPPNHLGYGIDGGYLFPVTMK